LPRAGASRAAIAMSAAPPSKAAAVIQPSAGRPQLSTIAGALKKATAVPTLPMP